MSLVSDGFEENKRLILSSLDDLNHEIRELGKDSNRAAVASERFSSNITTRLDAIESWRNRAEERLRDVEIAKSHYQTLLDWKNDAEKRIRDVEATRSQAMGIAALASVLVGVLTAILSKVLAR